MAGSGFVDSLLDASRQKIAHTVVENHWNFEDSPQRRVLPQNIPKGSTVISVTTQKNLPSDPLLSDPKKRIYSVGPDKIFLQGQSAEESAPLEIV